MKQISLKPHDHTEMREWLTEHRLTWADLARAAGVSGAAVSRYRRQQRPFPVNWILIWKQAYNWDWDELVRLCLRSY